MAVNDYIKITRSDASQRPTELARLVGNLREVQDLVRKIKGKMDHSYADATPAELEGPNGFGLAVGTGAAFITLFTNMRNRLNHADVDTFIDRVGE